MPRTKTGTNRREAHKKLLARTKGFRMTRNRLVKVAIEADLHAGQYAYVGRKERKQQMREIWIARINAAVAEQGIKYSRFWSAITKKGIKLNRKVLAAMAVKLPEAFKNVVTFTSK